MIEEARRRPALDAEGAGVHGEVGIAFEAQGLRRAVEGDPALQGTVGAMAPRHGRLESMAARIQKARVIARFTWVFLLVPVWRNFVSCLRTSMPHESCAVTLLMKLKA